MTDTISLYIENIIYMFINGFFIVKFAELFLVRKNQYYRYIFIGLLEVLNLLLLYYDNSDFVLWGLIILYFYIGYHGHIFKRIYIGLTAVMLLQMSIDIAFGINSLIDTYIFSFPVEFYFYFVYMFFAIILYFNYFIFKYMQNDYRFSSFKDLFWFLTSSILLNVCGYMIVHFPIAEISLINIHSFILMVLLESIFVMFAILTKRLNKSKEELIRQEIENYSKTFNETMVRNIEETYRNNRKLRHDLKNQLLAIEMRIKNGDQEEALNYIYQLTDQVMNTKVVKTHNETLNYIINSKIMAMEAQNIGFEYRIINTLSKLEPYDIVTIIGNLLDNAIEAQYQVRENKFIELNIVEEAGQTVIEVKNSYNKDLLIIEEGNLKTAKEDRENHGLGIENIKETINKYEGVYEMDIQDDVFVSRIKV